MAQMLLLLPSVSQAAGAPTGTAPHVGCVGNGSPVQVSARPSPTGFFFLQYASTSSAKKISTVLLAPHWCRTILPTGFLLVRFTFMPWPSPRSPSIWQLEGRRMTNRPPLSHWLWSWHGCRAVLMPGSPMGLQYVVN